jgi:8-oxo-dGTP pyrophosphatase MutT (NUDIX family)
MPPTDREIVTITDRSNKVIDALPRSLMRTRNLIHRAAYIVVINDKNELFLQKRSLQKDVYPGYWDIAAGGVVLADESYEAAACRELEEELGVTDVVLSHRFLRYFEDRDNKVWGSIFTCIHNGPFTLQKEEIDEGRFIKISALWELSRSELVTPDGLEVLQLLSDIF